MLQDEQKRTKELVARMEREKQLLLENASIRLHAAESECANLKEELTRQRGLNDKLEMQRQILTEQVEDLNNELNTSKEEMKMMTDQEIRYFYIRCI